MNSLDIDIVLNKLSIKFNRIFYDREFVACVSEDFQSILQNKNKCCVLVFPVLSPNYLKAVRYQAKIFDLAVFPLGSSYIKSVAVCHKKYLIQNLEVKEMKKEKMREISTESKSGTLRRKRPERQLYIPPAQRRSRLFKEDSPPIKNTPMPQSVQRKKTEEPVKEFAAKNERFISLKDAVDFLQNLCCVPLQWNYKLTKYSLSSYQHGSEYEKYIHFKDDLLLKLIKNLHIFDKCSSKEVLYVLDSYCLCWQPKLNFVKLTKNKIDANSKTYPFYSFNETEILCHEDIDFKRPSLLFLDYSVLLSAFSAEIENFNHLELSALKVLCNRNECSGGEANEIVDLSVVNYGHYFFIPYKEDFYFFECFEDHDVIECYMSKRNQKPNEDLPVVSHTTTNDNIDELANDKLAQVKNVLVEKSLDLIEQKCIEEKRTETPQMPIDTRDSVLENNIQSAKNLKQNKIIEQTKNMEKSDENQQLEGHLVIAESPVRQNNIKNNNKTTETTDTNIISTNEKSTGKILRKSSEHEQEKEIMRKTKENINRKTRPIMKYVGDDNDTLKIDKGDNVNNWEDLFDDHGQLQEDIFTEIVQKVGSNVTIVKAAEDYSAYASKHLEELEHMVELYDFPSTFETHDIIAAFSELNSDSMYVKWVDETHALLVLGSLTQAQRAVEISNTLIKVRPMSAASNIALAKANKFDLKPAMKRPQTNLQTARRLITTHLGTKSRVSREQSAKEREDLKAAREMKKLAKQNERDAWEGNLRSTVSN